MRTRLYKNLFGVVLAGLVPFILTTTAKALPIGFDYNQGDLEFMELKSQNFTVYHDKRAPEDAKLALRSLEVARPNLERWFQVSRSTPLIVNMSAESDNASFANFVTDSIELQTLGQGGRDLAWHEYTHSMMYRHLDNWFGPAGSILHLPWMEAWFLEGLAEAMSVSIGSDEQAGVERYQALTGSWPTWDQIHSLYTSGPFNFQGYATSGGFVAWLLRFHDAGKLPAMLKEFKSKSMPWYWPWAVTPFNGFLPMDTALKSMSGKSGRELYEQYKVDAAAYWKKQISTPVLSASFPRQNLSPSPWNWVSHNGTFVSSKPPEESASAQFAESPSATAWVAEYFPKANQRRYRVALAEKGKKINAINRGSNWIFGPWLTQKDVWWLETIVETTQLCHAPRESFKKTDVTCIARATMPSHLRLLGSAKETDEQHTATIWLSQDSETIKGDSHDIIEINLLTGAQRRFKSPVGGRPVSMASTSNSRWILTGSRSWRHAVKIDKKGQCEGIAEIADYPVRLLDSTSDLPHAVLYTKDGYGAVALSAKDFPLKPCHKFSERSSPLLAASQSQKAISLNDAVQAANTWTDSLAPMTDIKTAEAKLSPVKFQEATTEGATAEAVKNSLEKNADEPVSQPTTWKGRPIFAFPWIGADDAMGPQIGIISVPLMDQMQNETVRATVLVGTVSRFPYQDVTITTNRFTPTWSLTGFRAQTYNGRYRDSVTKDILSKYLEESGFHLDGSLSKYWSRRSIAWNWGFKTSHLKPYIGPAKRHGHLNEPYANVSLSASNGKRLYASTSLRGRIAPPSLNKEFHYDVLSAGVLGGVKVGRGKVELGLDGSRTRGPKRQDLQEMYSPLKTLIPGSGGGYNQTSFAVTPDAGLFTPVFGENQARAKLVATHPIIESVDKFVGLLYIDSLDVSGFLNYGTAWRGSDGPKKKNLIPAQGYNVDLFMDNKGVRFNLGLGTGQVLGKSWQGYWTFGFDAIF